MNLRLALALPLTLAAGFGMGRMIPVPDAAESPVQGQTALATSPTHDSSDISEAAGSSHEKSRRDPASSKQTEAKVSVPVGQIAGILRGGVMRNWNFMGKAGGLDDALTMLGVTGKERRDVLDLFEKARQDLLREELTQVKVSNPSGQKLTFDFSDMQESVARVQAETRAGISWLLPPDIAQALDDGVDWDRSYFTDANRNASVSIPRQPGGALGISFYGQATIGMGSLSGFDNYKDDGNPIPAEAVLPGERWAALIKGQTILPSDGEPRH